MEWNAIIGLGIVVLCAALVVVLLLVSRAASRRDQAKGLDAESVEADRAADKANRAAENSRLGHWEATDTWTNPDR